MAFDPLTTAIAATAFLLPHLRPGQPAREIVVSMQQNLANQIPKILPKKEI
jgi:hypothetical protein